MNSEAADQPTPAATPDSAALAPTARRCIPWRAIRKWTRRTLMAIIVGATLAMGFGMPPADAVKMRLFSDAVVRWQTNPDFRKVQVEYVELGSDAMRTKTAFVDTTTGIMALRSLPFLPKELAVNESSLRHYQNFTRGPLSAYLHLTTEQGVADTLKMLKPLGEKANLTDQDVVDFLSQYKMDWPVVKDAGSIQGVRALVRDIDPGRGFEVMENLRVLFDRQISAVLSARTHEQRVHAIAELLKATDTWWARAVIDTSNKLTGPRFDVFARSGNPVEVAQALREIVDGANSRDMYVVGGYVLILLRPEIQKVAAELGYPTDPAAMTPAQQKDVWARLDDRIRETNYELWRVKQVNDWLNGMWAQVYGSVYASVIGPTLAIRDACQVLGPLMLLSWVGFVMLKRRAGEDEPAAAPAPEPLPAA
ncbi:MAG TPA: hypothetical protein VEA69_17365 [Tepidisphaeraceae bacterium]|nr:hypothetical protein [Tepidisphaeraceae bacterium]